jgi:hypothetical protein
MGEGVLEREWVGLETRIFKMFSRSGKQGFYRYHYHHHHPIWRINQAVFLPAWTLRVGIGIRHIY